MCPSCGIPVGGDLDQKSRLTVMAQVDGRERRHGCLYVACRRADQVGRSLTG